MYSCVTDDTSSFGLDYKKILKKITTFYISHPHISKKDPTQFPIFREEKSRRWMAIIMVVAMEVAEFLF